MIAVDSIEKDTIRSHYDLGTFFYRILWGPHIHHGLWKGNESSYEAQCNLTDTMADFAKVEANTQLLDVGCGMGGSSIRLAKLRGCQATGVTLSPVQRRWASISSLLNGVRSKTKFLCQDAEKLQIPNNTFDVVWSIECTEHLFDKEAFFQRAAQWLKPGGRLVIAVWFEGKDTSQPGHRALVEDVCRRFICPSLATQQDYSDWITKSGLVVKIATDWTDSAIKTWQICQQRVQKSRVRYLARILDKHQVSFLDGFETLLRAYQSGAMQYGVLVAERPK